VDVAVGFLIIRNVGAAKIRLGRPHWSDTRSGSPRRNEMRDGPDHVQAASPSLRLRSVMMRNPTLPSHWSPFYSRKPVITCTDSGGTDVVVKTGLPACCGTPAAGHRGRHGQAL